MDLGDQRAARHGDNDVLRQTPAELLGDFISHGLRTLGVVGAQVDVDDAPGVLLRNFGAKAVHLIVIALHVHQVGAVNLRGDDFLWFEVGGNEDERLKAAGRSLRRHRVGEISR